MKKIKSPKCEQKVIILYFIHTMQRKKNNKDENIQVIKKEEGEEKMRNKKRILMISFIVIALFCMCVLEVSHKKKEESLSISAEALSNKKIGWGIKRADNNEQPDLGSKNKELLDKYDGIAMGNTAKKQVYLTFDEGYEAGYTPKLLQVLKQNNVTATFFLTAHFINTQPELVQQMIDEGQVIGNHTVNHKSMPDLAEDKIKEEIMNLHTAVYEKYGYEMKYIRPPKGEFSERTLSITKSLGYTTVMWSFAYDDWNEQAQKGEAYAKEKILKNVHPGSVLLLHGNSKDNTNVLDECIKEIKAMGYEFKSLDEFIR